jgi:hypothetical protein
LMFMHHLPGPDRWTAARRRRWFRPDPNPRLAQHRLQRCAILSSLGQTREKGKIAHASVVWPREHAQLSRGFKKDGPARRRTGDESLFQGGREGGREGGEGQRKRWWGPERGAGREVGEIHLPGMMTVTGTGCLLRLMALARCEHHSRQPCRHDLPPRPHHCPPLLHHLRPRCRGRNPSDCSALPRSPASQPPGEGCRPPHRCHLHSPRADPSSPLHPPSLPPSSPVPSAPLRPFRGLSPTPFNCRRLTRLSPIIRGEHPPHLTPTPPP